MRGNPWAKIPAGLRQGHATLLRERLLRFVNGGQKLGAFLLQKPVSQFLLLAGGSGRIAS
ncbi:MAG: hypothetical protein KA788_13355 [Lacunisphaera sp.]|nr:hypothetical protein [Lacunisphaera sp.]